MRDDERELSAEQLQQIKAAARRRVQELGPVSVETMRRVAQIMAPAFNKLYGHRQQ
jgi:hypothetical protein